MMIGFEVGNSHIVATLFAPSGQIRHSWRKPTDPNCPPQGYADWLLPLLQDAGVAAMDLRQLVIASVVPAINQPLADFCRQHLGHEAHLLTREALLSIQPQRLSNPDSIGLDRLLNVIGGRSMIAPPFLTLDMGTATNIEVADPDGALIGGIIAPGIMMMQDALHSRIAAPLPHVPIAATPHLGRDTATAMQAGLYWLNVYGLAGLLRGLLTELHLADSTPILATGGLAASLFPDLQRQLPQLQLVGDLTLRGLWLASQQLRLAKSNKPA